MKISKFTFLSAFFCAVSLIAATPAVENAASAPAAVKIRLSLADAKEMALRKNPTLAMALANIESAAAAVRRAQAAYYPSLDLEAGATRLRDAATRPGRDFDNHSNYSLGLSASWLIFNGGIRHFNDLIAREGSATALKECDDARRILMENVALAYYVVIQSQNSMNIASQDAEFNRQLHEDAKKKLDHGVCKPSEVLNFEYQVDKAEADYISAKQTWKNACIALGHLLAIPQDAIWDNIEILPPDDKVLNSYQINVPQLLDYAFQHRPDLQAAQSAVTQAELQLKIARAGWMPTVAAFANYGYDRDDKIKFNKHYDRNITYGVSASWNVFNGFATEATIAQALANVKIARENLEALRLSVDAEIRNNAVALESSREILEKQNKLLKIATEIRNLVREEYHGGTATITRLNEVQTDLTNTALAQATAYVTVLNNLERLTSSTSYNIYKDTNQPEEKK
ncbi:MAG: TolC family protein [Victivallales bacterium]|nr:TolC family protein [Victivallales bacterium]